MAFTPCRIIFFALLSHLICQPSGSLFAQPVSSRSISLSDTNRIGGIDLHFFKEWNFSFQKPPHIGDRINLHDGIPISRLADFSAIKSQSEWNNYGWAEIEVISDSSLAGRPFLLAYRSLEAVRVWLNGKLVLSTGHTSQNGDDEVLSRFINTVFTGIVLREGSNFLLVEFSGHSITNIHQSRAVFGHGLELRLLPNQEPRQRLERGVIFGGAMLLLLNLVLIHVFLAIRFKGSYHVYVALTTFFMLLHAFGTLSDTLFDWSNQYMYFFVYDYVLSYLFVVYFFLISIRKFYDLPIAWKTSNSTLALSIGIGIYAVHFNYGLVTYLHTALLLLVLGYGIYSLYEAKKNNSRASVKIIAFGLGATLLGAFLYAGIYLVWGKPINVLLYVSTLLAYTSIPVSLTLTVATSYAKLITTLEEKVADRTAKLEASNAFQKRFFANVSHEFRTPLTISEGLVTKVLQSENRNIEETRYDLWLAKRNMVRLHDMVNQIIDLTKSDHSELVLNQKNLYAIELVSLCVEFFRSLAEHHGHTFTYRPSSVDLVLYVDQSSAEIMINNLISNAIKFTPDGGTIDIATTISGEFFSLTVTDSGPGIPADKREIVFERFHRLTQPDDAYVEGMGVGLELSRTLARMHGGDIKTRPNPKGGSVFELSLPVSKEVEKPVMKLKDGFLSQSYVNPKPKVEETSETSFNVLLVEDNDDLSHYVGSILSPLGTVEKAKNGKEALEKMETFTPDLIITDLMMPIMGGVPFIEHVSAIKNWSEIPIIVLTAKALEEDKTNLLRIGVVDYITKPFSPEQLLLKSKNLLAYYQKKRSLHINIQNEPTDVSKSLADQTAQFILENVNDANLSVDSLAATFAMSRSTFYRMIEQEAGMTPAEFIREIRLTTARSIAAKDRSIRLEALANAVGYKSATSFRKSYQERFGEHPISGS